MNVTCTGWPNKFWKSLQKVSFYNFASGASYVHFSSKSILIQMFGDFAKDTEESEVVGTPCIVCNFHDFYYCKYNGNEITLLCCSSIFYDLTSTFWQLIYSSDLPGTLTSIINVKSFLHPLKLKFRAKVFVVGCH